MSITNQHDRAKAPLKLGLGFTHSALCFPLTVMQHGLCAAVRNLLLWSCASPAAAQFWGIKVHVHPSIQMSFCFTYIENVGDAIKVYLPADEDLA